MQVVADLVAKVDEQCLLSEFAEWYFHQLHFAVMKKPLVEMAEYVEVAHLEQEAVPPNLQNRWGYLV
jgi:hypothetical protein